MSNAPLAKVEAPTAAQICARFLISPQVRAMVTDGMEPGAFLEVLMANRQYVAGIDFVAFALPAREAVWWGCLCFQHACGEGLSAVDKAAAAAAVQWVMQPSDAARGAAKEKAEAAGPASAAGALAMAVYQTGPGIAPQGRQSAVAQPFAAARSVANAIKIVCTKSDPSKMIEAQKAFVELGIGVAGGCFV